MKCPNCGYNCDDKYCAMCGTKLPEQPVNTNPNPYESAPANNNFQPENFSQSNNADFNSGFGNPNPYNQPHAPVNNANPFQGGMPVPPAYPAPPQYSNTPKKKSKALPIILTCLISAVIVAGAVISVYSACTYNQSILVGIIGDNSDNYDDYYIDEEYYPDTTEYIDDVKTHKIGETKELSDCKITLTKFERDKSAEESKTGNSRTKFVFEVENTTDENITLNYIYCDAVTADSFTSLDWLSNNLENNDTYSDYISLEPNEKKELIFEYSVPNDAEKIRLDLSFYGDGDKYEYSGTFVAE